jgi:hypothetical protein
MACLGRMPCHDVPWPGSDWARDLMVEERRELQPAARGSLIYRSIIVCVRDLPWGE